MSLWKTAKFGIFLASLIVVSPLILLCRLERLLWKRNLIYKPVAELLALGPGLPGIYIRAAFYFGVLERCSWTVHVGFGSVLVNWPAKLGEHVTIGSYCILGHADIGPGVQMASRVSIPSGKRQHLDDSGRLTKELHYETVTIGEGCWIGEGAIVMADIAPYSIVSAGAVVVDPVPEYSIVGGNPARIIGQVTKGEGTA